ncbi:MAG: antibiotic biosynthesis monooxygenase [Acidobacteriota bacterium]|nr:antibiotic biosynthesis monooxygenase [Acidobacteriota bacterium]
MNDEKIVLFARLKVKKDAVDDAKRAALAIVGDSRAEVGCINYDFHQAIEDETIFLWHETWTNEVAIDAHGNSPHFKQFSAAVKDITDEPLQVTLTKMVSEKV